MTVYPAQLDDDETIVRIDDNLSELGTEAINQLRSAMFAVQSELGTNPSGTLNSVADRLAVSLNPNGTIRSSALTSVGLATLPIDDAQVGASAGIKETKLALDYSTADLNAQLVANSNTISSIAAFQATDGANLTLHITGAVNLSDGSPARHVGSHIDINSVPFDSRDPLFVWTGLLDRDGNPRSATTVAEALLQINDAFVAHENDQAGDAHFATGISISTDNFETIPKSADTVQKAIDAIDLADALVIKEHQADQHSNGVPRESRSKLIGDVDGYSYNIIPPTSASAFLVDFPATSPVDNNTTGDDIISFSPDNTGNLFDEKFAKVSVGDEVRVNYGNGIEGIFNVKSKRHLPGSEWIIRLNGNNLYHLDGYEAFVRVDRKPFDNNKYGVVAVAAANNDIDSSIMPSVIVGSPKGANALGLGFDATQLDSSHYKLYLAMYPTGDPNDDVVQLPAIDVTGNAGITPGYYTLESVVEATNDAFRAGGFNYRFIAYAHDGNFGIALADSISNVSFSIISGSVSGGSLIEGAFTENVVGDATDDKDALGFGVTKAGFASPLFSTSYDSAESARSFPVTILPPLQDRKFSVNGLAKDSFATTYLTTDDYWDGYISARTPVGLSTVETTYQVEGNLARAELKAGKTIVVQPAIERDDSLFSEVDYGRFVIKSVVFQECCATDPAVTYITVVNSLHASGSPIGTSASPELPVRLYFSEDSVGFNTANVIEAINIIEYSRYHEIYINDEGKTFSHERARMPVQAETTSLVNTENFKVLDISPKLKGYLDDGSSDPNRYVRFYVLNYNSTSGEYDGYIGRRVAGSDTITDFGRVTRAKKDVPARFYDTTDVDFVELVFTEPDQYPGTAIISSADPRYVDIEVFDTQRPNQENFLLAGCTLIGNRVESVIDLREFGNVSEIDFTDSAIKFIESGDRYLHENGVIAGLTLIGPDESVDGRIVFNGGLVLVNGHIATLGQSSISIPEVVRDTGASQTSILDWVICVNESGNLEALPLTLNKEQFFIRRSSDVDNYYIESTTFDEILNERKDLAIVAVANVTIASITINTVTDARKFAGRNEGSYTVSEISGYDGYNATFRSGAALENWVRWSTISDYRVKYMEIDEPIDLRDNRVPIKIHNGTVLVNSDNGFLIDENITIEGVDFVYNYEVVGGADPANLTHADLKVACINMAEGTGNIDIVRCKFRQTNTVERTPYIGYFNSVDTSPQIENVNIEYCEFEESSNSLNCAVIFAFFDSSFNAGVSDTERFITDINIYKNRIYGQQSIIIGSEDSGFKPKTVNINIEKNHMPDGLIGYTNAEDIPSDPQDGIDISINIDKNYCYGITTTENDGLGVATGYGNVGNARILNNTCSIIQVFNLGQESGTVISGNKCYARTLVTDFGFNENRAIDVTAGSAIISNNHIHYNHRDAVAYTIGILGNSDSQIVDNWLHDLSFTDVGIVGSRESTVRGNKINRGSQDITNYIQLTSADAVCTDNIFDSRYTDVGNTLTTIISETTTNGGNVITSNVNHLQTVKFHLAPYFGPRGGTSGSGGATVYNRFFDQPQVDNVRADSSNESGLTIEMDPGGAADLIGVIPLSTVIPSGGKFVSAQLSYLVFNSVDVVSGDITLRGFGDITGGPGGGGGMNGATDTAAVSAGGSTLTIDGDGVAIDKDQTVIIINVDDLEFSGSGGSVVFTTANVTYVF